MSAKGPFDVAAGDGNTYFAKLDPSVALIRGYQLCLAARDVYLRLAATIADPAQKLDARAQAAACDLVVQNVSDGANAVAATTAVAAEKAIKHVLDAKQLRPDPPGSSHHLRLRDAISCRPISGGSGLGTLEVGIGDESVLDSAVGDSDGQPYWRAQEFGSGHNVGRRIKGLYQPGDAAPDPGAFRTHPVFQTGVEGSVPMLIERPIPEKAFLREGAVIAEGLRDKEFRTVGAAASRELTLIRTGNAGTLGSIRRVIR